MPSCTLLHRAIRAGSFSNNLCPSGLPPLLPRLSKNRSYETRTRGPNRPFSESGEPCFPKYNGGGYRIKNSIMFSFAMCAGLVGHSTGPVNSLSPLCKQSRGEERRRRRQLGKENRRQSFSPKKRRKKNKIKKSSPFSSLGQRSAQ